MDIIDLIKTNISKLVVKGDIIKTYEKMYWLAEKIADHELKKEVAISHEFLGPKQDPDKILKIQKNMAEFKQKRIQHHVNEIKKLLILRGYLTKNKKNNNRGRHRE